MTGYQKKLYSFRRQGNSHKEGEWVRAVPCRGGSIVFFSYVRAWLTAKTHKRRRRRRKWHAGMTARSGAAGGSDVLVLRPGGERLEVWEGTVTLDSFRVGERLNQLCVLGVGVRAESREIFFFLCVDPSAHHHRRHHRASVQ